MKESNKKKLFKMLEKQRFAVIATEGKKEPYTNLVAFLASEYFRKIYFPTSKNTRKYKNLSANSRISILFDNRGNKPNDIKKAMAVTAVGRSKETKNQEIVNLFLKKHPYMKDFVKSPDCAMIEINVDRYISVDNFQNVNVFDISMEK